MKSCNKAPLTIQQFTVARVGSDVLTVVRPVNVGDEARVTLKTVRVVYLMIQTHTQTHTHARTHTHAHVHTHTIKPTTNKDANLYHR
jgi:hypothetical protein